MKRNLLFAAMMLVAGSLLAADSTPKDDVTNAAKKLAEKDNYSWKSTVEIGGGVGAPFGGLTEGKTEKSGVICLTMTRRDTSMEVFMKTGKGAFKGQDGWQTFAEAAEAQQGPGRFIGLMMQNFKAPAAQVENLADKIKELKKTDDVYAGDLTEEGAKALLSFRPGGGGGDAPANAKGSIKIWLKDGIVSKFQIKLQGTIQVNGEDRDIDRTTTVEIKDVGTTKISVPEEAAKKLP
ncbi:MAG: hypothetical protein JWR26_3711 [Pedosphaera sp.]|nr:hypothetical protein [Pedosphaera sp.]